MVGPPLDAPLQDALAQAFHAPLPRRPLGKPEAPAGPQRKYPGAAPDSAWETLPNALAGLERGPGLEPESKPPRIRETNF